MKRATKILSLVALGAILAAGIAKWRNLPNAVADSHQRIRLQNRTIELSAAGEALTDAAELPRLTARGTRVVLVQMCGDATVSARRILESYGARILGVIPPHGFAVEVAEESRQRLADCAEVLAVVTEAVADKLGPGLALDSPAEQALTVLPLRAEDAECVRAQVAAAGGRVLETATEPLRLQIALPGTAVKALATNGEVRWIERFVRPRLLNDVAVSEGHLNVQSVRETCGLTGRGQFITTSDSGIDTGDLTTMHADLRTNVVGFAKSYDWVDATDGSGHGTHTAGSIVGTGAESGGQFRGVACEAKLWAWFCLYNGGIYSPTDKAELFRPSALTGGTAYIHSASWGGDTNCYNSESVAFDTYLWNHPDFMAVFAAGNYGEDGAETVHCEAGAKNVLAVGASGLVRPDQGGPSNSNNQVASFSSRGPMPDGRIKPDLVAPGTYVVSTRSSQASTPWYYVYDDHYRYMSGTSMACPLAAGTAALVRQWLVERRGFTNAVPSAALMKAVMMGGADDLYGRETSNVSVPAPNDCEGWGRINLAETLYPSNRTVTLFDRVPFTEGSAQAYALTVTNAGPLDIQLVWTDYPGAPEAELALVNDLDLVLSNKTSAAVWYGNGGTGGDRINNAESIRLTVAEAGEYVLLVRGVRVAYDYRSGGAAALYVRGAAEAAAEPEETVRLTVTTAGGLGQCECSPAAGVHEYAKGMTVKLSATEYSCATSSVTAGLAISRAPLIGFSGTGVMPAAGTTNEVQVTLTEDSSVEWRWSETATQHRLRILGYNDGEYDTWSDYYIFSDGGYVYNTTVLADQWLPAGSEITLRPTDYALGDSYVYEGWIYYYDYRHWNWGNWYGVIDMRLGSLILADCGDTGSGTYQSDAKGRMPVPMSLTMDRPYDVYYTYYEVGDRVDGYPPYWWYMRYLYGAAQQQGADATLTGDPDADGFNNEAEYAEATDPVDDASFPFKMREFSPTNLVFTGSVKGTLILERKARLGDDWVGVWTNSAVRTSVSNSVKMTTWATSNGFYRVIYRP